MEAQYQNRFLIWREEGTQLSTRSIFKSNPANYLNVITAYTYKYLREQADEYIALGKIEAGNKANATLDIIYEKKQTITASKEDALFENLEQFKTIFEEGRFCLSPFYFKAPDGSIFITNKSKFASAFLNEYFDENEAKTLNRHKDVNIILGLGENPQRTTINLGGSLRKQGYLFIDKKVQSYANNVNTNGFNDFIFA
jgi:hypothetical protein